MTANQLRALYAAQAAELGRTVAVARIATNAGAGGRHGKRYAGKFFHQLVAMHEDRLASSRATDAELAPMLNVVNRAMGGGK